MKSREKLKYNSPCFLRFGLNLLYLKFEPRNSATRQTFPCHDMSSISRPRFLKKVIVYSKQYNHVIEFEANQTLGIHLPTLVLPTIPHKSKRGGELFNRFWHLMKSYHILASVVFHVPGKGVTRVRNRFLLPGQSDPIILIDIIILRYL